MLSSRTLIITVVVILGALVLTNPDETKFRGHIQEQQGILGTLSIGLADLLNGGGGRGGIHRDNYLVCSKFYIGGDGILPREDIAWGMAGHFFEINNDLGKETKERARPRY